MERYEPSIAVCWFCGRVTRNFSKRKERHFWVLSCDKCNEKKEVSS